MANRGEAKKSKADDENMDLKNLNWLEHGAQLLFGILATGGSDDFIRYCYDLDVNGKKSRRQDNHAENSVAEHGNTGEHALT